MISDNYGKGLPKAVADRILREAITQIPGFICRTHQESVALPALQAQDQKILSLAKALYGVNILTPLSLIQLSLPLSLGGLAIRNSCSTLKFANLGAWANAAPEILKILPGFNHDSLFLEIDHCIRVIRVETNIPEVLPPVGSSGLETLKFYSMRRDLAKNLQGLLSQSAHLQTAISMKLNAPD